MEAAGLGLSEEIAIKNKNEKFVKVHVVFVKRLFTNNLFRIHITKHYVGGQNHINCHNHEKGPEAARQRRAGNS